MRIARSTLIGTAVAMALFGRNDPAQARPLPAQEHTQPATKRKHAPVTLQAVVVSGIRYSLDKSLALERAAVGTVSVVTAESIGKMPDRNVADALQRLPGVDISTAGATEGGFAESDRVSLRGLSPGLTMTTLNGHSVASGDWFVLDQSQEAGRSFDYTLLPAEIVKEIKVYKTPEASLPAGGVAGEVDVVTREALDFNKAVTLEADVGAVHDTLANHTDPQFNALGDWMNSDRTFGVMLQVFSETEHFRRDGQEMLGYNQISPTSPVATANPALANVYYPSILDAAYFTQRTQRNGGNADIEWRPDHALTFNVNLFSSKLEATNYNRSYSIWPSEIIGEGLAPSQYTVQGNTLTSATWAPVAGKNFGVYDQISRPDESASTNWADFSGKWRPDDNWAVSWDAGASFGHSRTPNQNVLETLPGVGAGGSYTMHGTATAASWNLGNTINTSPTPGGTPVAFSWIFGDQNIDVLDAERWGKIDADYALDRGVFSDLKFGVDYKTHDRHLWNAIGQGPACDGGAFDWGAPPYYCAAGAQFSAYDPANYPTGYQNFPTNFGFGLGSGFPTQIWYFTPAQLAAYDQSYTTRNPITRADWTVDFGLQEKDTSGYVQLDLNGHQWSGNVGVRFVRTQDSIVTNVGVPATTPGAITTSAFGPYAQVTTDHSYTDVLPSANLKLDLTHDLVGRLAVAQTMARPAYSALAGSTSLEVPATYGGGVGTGTGSNPNLAPIKATNVNAGLEWYFNPKSVLSAEAYYMRLSNYVSYGTVNEQFMTFDTTHPQGFEGTYAITAPEEANANVHGVELNYEQQFFSNWGLEANATFNGGSATNPSGLAGGNRVVGLSKETYNIVGFYENSSFSARVAYTYRSQFFSGVDRSTAFTMMGEGTLAASLNYNVNKIFSISLVGQNLNNPELKYYAANQDQPRAFYMNGRQYFLDFRFVL